jgi:hypothetical protein
MKRRSKKPQAPTRPRAIDPEKLAEPRGGDAPIVLPWDPEQHNETFVRRARRRR